jgi:nicotinamide mononucleotide transporter
MQTIIFTIIETLAAIFSLWCVYLAGKNKILNWPISMLASFLYFGVFYKNRFYSDAYLQIVFLVFQSFGWYQWYIKSKFSNIPNNSPQSSTIKEPNSDNETTTSPIRSLSWSEIFNYSSIFLVFWGCYYLAYLNFFENPRAPLLDTFLTSISLLALYLQAKRIINHWFLWIFADILYVPLYFWGEQYITSALYAIFIGLAFWGWKSWQKEKAAQTSSLFK